MYLYKRMRSYVCTVTTVGLFSALSAHAEDEKKDQKEPPPRAAVEKEVAKAKKPKAPLENAAAHADGKAKETGDVVSEFAVGTPEATLRAAFRCVLEMGENDGFSCYANLNVDSNHDNDNATSQLRRYQWAKFRERAKTYVVEDTKFSVRITRRDPVKLDADGKEQKLFLFSKIRDNPAPIVFRKEAGAWRIYENSL